MTSVWRPYLSGKDMVEARIFHMHLHTAFSIRFFTAECLILWSCPVVIVHIQFFLPQL
ncbi:unnamed protein product [Amoebophrya sp. A120]|nr:unnamed protein product [Amoebophrya sp. A120]|eukprot:GSA120T00026126001.1